MSTPKSFSSSIPEHLLTNETPAMQFLMNELSKNTQATEYLLKRREESGEILDAISKKLDYTNGSIAEAKRDIYDLQEKSKKQEEISKDLNQIVAAKNIVVKLACSKLLWTASLAILFFGISTGFFSELFKWVFSTVGLN